MLVERRIKIDEVREEAACGHLACKLVEVIVAVLRKVAYASLLLPYLDRENGCGTVADTFICGVKNLADDASSLC